MTTPIKRQRLHFSFGEVFLRIGEQLITIDWEGAARTDACGHCWHGKPSHFSEPHTTRCEHYVNNTRAGVCPCPGYKSPDPVTKDELINIAMVIAVHILETKGRGEVDAQALQILASEVLASRDEAGDPWGDELLTKW